MSLFIYAIQSVNGGPVKIGQTANVEKRLSEIQVGHHEDLVVVDFFDAFGATDRKVHEDIDESLRVRGEWYRDDPEVWRAFRIVKACCAIHRKIDQATRLAIKEVEYPFDRESIVRVFDKAGQEIADALCDLYATAVSIAHEVVTEAEAA